MASYYEIGGQIFDGSFGYDHRKFKRVKRELRRGNPHIAVGIATSLVLDKMKQVQSVEDIPYSDMQLGARKWAQEKRRTVRRLLAPLPLPPQVKVPLYVVPEAVEAWSYATGSYDLRTPEVQRYEESVHFGGSGGMII